MASVTLATKRWFICVDGSHSATAALTTTLVDLAQPARKDVLYVYILLENSDATKKVIADVNEFFGVHKDKLDAGLSFELVHDATRVSDKKKIANEICAAARRHGADFIVTGNRGCSGVKKALLGSVSSDVLNHAHCPVIVVRESST